MILSKSWSLIISLPVVWSYCIVISVNANIIIYSLFALRWHLVLLWIVDVMPFSPSTNIQKNSLIRIGNIRKLNWCAVFCSSELWPWNNICAVPAVRSCRYHLVGKKSSPSSSGSPGCLPPVELADDELNKIRRMQTSCLYIEELKLWFHQLFSNEPKKSTFRCLPARC